MALSSSLCSGPAGAPPAPRTPASFSWEEGQRTQTLEGPSLFDLAGHEIVDAPSTPLNSIEEARLERPTLRRAATLPLRREPAQPLLLAEEERDSAPGSGRSRSAGESRGGQAHARDHGPGAGPGAGPGFGSGFGPGSVPTPTPAPAPGPVPSPSRRRARQAPPAEGRGVAEPVTPVQAGFWGSPQRAGRAGAAK